MESSRLDGAAEGRCALLRWKGLYVEATPDLAAACRDDGLFWCGLTQTCLAPDGRAVDAYECNQERFCYEKV
jgi:hypothetical protein